MGMTVLLALLMRTNRYITEDTQVKWIKCILDINFESNNPASVLQAVLSVSSALLF